MQLPTCESTSTPKDGFKPATASFLYRSDEVGWLNCNENEESKRLGKVDSSLLAPYLLLTDFRDDL